MSRLELYAKIKELSLQEAIKEKTGKNFTQVSNIELENFIKTAQRKNKSTYTKRMTKISSHLKRLCETEIKQVIEDLKDTLDIK